MRKPESAPAAFGVRVLVPAAVALGLALPAVAQDAERGAELAETWCNACHYTGVNDPRMFDAGPHFSELAGRETLYLLDSIVRPHDFMPEFPRLGYSDLRDLVAFIQTVEAR